MLADLVGAPVAENGHSFVIKCICCAVVNIQLILVLGSGCWGSPAPLWDRQLQEFCIRSLYRTTGPFVQFCTEWHITAELTAEHPVGLVLGRCIGGFCHLAGVLEPPCWARFVNLHSCK